MVQTMDSSDRSMRWVVLAASLVAAIVAGLVAGALTDATVRETPPFGLPRPTAREPIGGDPAALAERWGALADDRGLDWFAHGPAEEVEPGGLTHRLAEDGYLFVGTDGGEVAWIRVRVPMRDSEIATAMGEAASLSLPFLIVEAAGGIDETGPGITSVLLAVAEAPVEDLTDRVVLRAEGTVGELVLAVAITKPRHGMPIADEVLSLFHAGPGTVDYHLIEYTVTRNP